MIRNLSSHVMKAARAVPVLLVLGMAGVPAASGQTEVPFTVEFSGNVNVPTIRVVNRSRLEITRFQMTVGDISRNWDFVSGFSFSGGGSVLSQSPDQVNDGDRSFSIILNLSGFGPGNAVTMQADLDRFGAGNTGEDYRTVLFNNGTAPNCVVTVTTLDGATETMTLPDGLIQGSYLFSKGHRTLAVKSLAEADSSEFVRRVTVRVTNSFSGTLTGSVITNVGPEISLNVFDGETVEITAPREVYKNIFGVDITDSVSGDPEIIKNDAEERFTAIGISVNDVAQTGDPTLFRFDITRDTVVVVKWSHDYALTVRHDFTATRSADTDSTGAAWAGPLASEASGNPLPAAQKHWVKRGETRAALVDGKVDDYSRPGLDIRYLPKAFRSYGPPNPQTTPANDTTDRLNNIDIRQPLQRGIEDFQGTPGLLPLTVVSTGHGLTNGSRIVISAAGTNAYNGQYVIRNATANAFQVDIPFAGNPGVKGTWSTPSAVPFDFNGKPFSLTLPQSPPQRQQVPQFTMYGPGGITYVWQIQLGAKVNIDDPSRAALPKVFAVTNTGGPFVEVGNLEGTFWFNPGATIRIGSAANFQSGTNSKALRGWINGDGWFFSSSGDVNSDSGALTQGGPAVRNGSPVATWITNFLDGAGTLYRGLEIPNLQRAARVLWRYDTPEIRVNATIGEYVFQNDPARASLFTVSPEQIIQDRVDGVNKNVGNTDMAVWDPEASRLYPLVPGVFKARWRPGPQSPSTVEVIVTASYPTPAHYPHVVNTPAVALDPDPADNFVFKEIKYSENQAVVDGQKRFTANTAGKTVLLFGEIQSAGRGSPREFLRVRVVDSKNLNQVQQSAATAIIGRKITDPALDLANLGTGFVVFQNARYNPFIYNPARLEGLAAKDIYDLVKLRANPPQKVVTRPELLPGPVIPVNLHPGAAVNSSNKVVVVWYADPTRHDGLLWPHAARAYDPVWPITEPEGLGRIVIASQFGSESQVKDNGLLLDQEVVPVIGNSPRATTYNPSRLQQVQIYHQPNTNGAGYNPNEEHALIAASLRFADVSPRPPAVYALRNNDLNIFATSLVESAQPANYTSHPRVLVQFFDTADSEFKMRVYEVVKEDLAIPGYRFPNQGVVTIPAGASQVTATPNQLTNQPSVKMEAGEPVIPFYPLGVVIGASPCADTFGVNLKGQTVYWEDHRGSSWGISGGSNAWFTVSFYYPLAPDFWWPRGKSGLLRDLRTMEPQAGDCLSFLPPNIASLMSVATNVVVAAGSAAVTNNSPTKVLYKGEWPVNPPVLKAGETLTFQGGEFRGDNPFRPIIGGDGQVQMAETPGLPAIVAFASADVVFDSLNPTAGSSQWRTSWTARAAQVLDVRSVSLTLANFPATLSPATKRTRVKQGKYVFNDLPASLQKRVRYDPLGGKLEIIGLLNDKEIGDRTLTAAPPAVYVLEPNIFTPEEKNQLLDLSESTSWQAAVNSLDTRSRNPEGLGGSGNYLVGLEPEIVRNSAGLPVTTTNQTTGIVQVQRNPANAAPYHAFGPGLALLPNPDFLNPSGNLPEISWVAVAENNDRTLGGSPITIHIIQVDRRHRYRGAIKTIASDNVFDENLMLRHQGDFGANADALIFEWWYRPDDGSLNVPPPDLLNPGQPNPWKLFPDPSGNRGAGRFQVLLKGNPNAPETLLADTFWFCRYRHQNDAAEGTNWRVRQPDNSPQVNFTWAGAGNSDPFNDFDQDGIPDYRAQLAQGWIKRVLDAVNPYEARIRDFDGDNPDTRSSMISQFGARFEGPVALNPDKNVIENVGLIELYETILKRGRDLSIDLSQPVSTPAVANALQLASTRISDFYTILGNEAYTDGQDPTIGFGSDSVEYGSLAPAVFSFQNQMSSLIEEELAMLRGVDDFFARPVYNRLFWNFTKGEGEAAYAMNYNVSDINQDGFIDEDDAMILYPQGHGDAWGHYLIALRNQYELLKHPFFNWVSRSEFYNLQDIVIKVDFLDERKFAQVAAAKAKAGAETVNLTYRQKYVEDPTAQWQGYTDSNKDRAWGVQEWARRAGQGAYFDWVTANALLPSEHPNDTLEGIQKVDRKANSDIAVISANLNAIQTTFDQANRGQNPLGLSGNVVPFDISPQLIDDLISGKTHFEQVYDRAIKAMENAVAIWDNANEDRNRLRQVANSEAEFRNAVFQEDLSYQNRLIKIFGRPYAGTIGPGRIYPAGYNGPDLLLFQYVDVREITARTVPGPSTSFATFNTNGVLSGGDINQAFANAAGGAISSGVISIDNGVRTLFASTFATNAGVVPVNARDGWYAVNYTDLLSPKVPLDNLTQLLPVTAAGYTFQAPPEWESRLAVGELQTLINKMIQQEAEVAIAIGAWDALTGEIVRTLRLANANLATSDTIRNRNERFILVKTIAHTAITGLAGLVEVYSAAQDTVTSAFGAGAGSIPKNLPTGGLAISPGDALAPAAAAFSLAGATVSSGIGWFEALTRVLKLVEELGLQIYEDTVMLDNDRDERTLAKKELLKGLEDLVGDEPIKRIAIFKEIEALRELSDQYRAMVDEGTRLIDERAAYNKRVAAQTQRNRYQDMTFRVSRNHALQNYRSAFDVAARYAYLAAKAYDYETNFDPASPGSPSATLIQIIRARGLGHFDGEARFGKGGLAESLAWLKAHYDLQKGQLGINNPQFETGKMSLRTEHFRILPKGFTQPVATNLNSQFPSPGANADTLWRQTLQNGRVVDLWMLPEYRYNCRPFASETDAAGNHVAEPGIVLRFSSQIFAGKNFFGRPLSGGDHAYDPSRYTTKIRSIGAWFSDYLSQDVLSQLPATPRLYLIPTGTDVMSIPTSPNPSLVRLWKVLDQRIPVPFPATTAALESANFIPLTDTLDGRLGDPRQFSMFRAYHDGGDAVNADELVSDSRLIGRSVWNTQWLIIIPGRILNADPNVGLDRFIDQVSDIKLVFETYSYSGN